MKRKNNHYQSMKNFGQDSAYNMMMTTPFPMQMPQHQIQQRMPQQQMQQPFGKGMQPGADRYPEFIDTDEYKPSQDVYFDTKHANKMTKDKRLNYFLPAIDDTNKKTSLMYPTVIDDEMIMTSKGIVPRTSRKNGIIKSYNGPIGRLVD